MNVMNQNGDIRSEDKYRMRKRESTELELELSLKEKLFFSFENKVGNEKKYLTCHLLFAPIKVC